MKPMTEEEFKNRLEILIHLETVQFDPKVPVHFYSAYIDGKLYKNNKKKTVWNRKCDVVNSLKHNSDTFRCLKGWYEEKLAEEHPEWFDRLIGSRLWPKSQHYRDISNAINERIDAWWNEHVEIREVFQSE